MTTKAFQVHIINPRKKTGKKTAKKVAKKKATRTKRAKKTTTTTVASKTTRRSTNPMPRKKKVTRRRRKSRGTSPVRQITRRRRNPTPNPKRRRRRVASYARAGFSGVVNEMKNSLPRMVGKLATAWVVRRYSQSASGLFGQSHTSPMMGEGWSFPQYALAGAVAMWGPKLFGRWLGGNGASQFRAGAVDLMMEKLIWTEGIARNQWAVGQFGTGDVGYGQYGQAYVNQGNSWNAMQGLVGASPLDGLVESSPLDGDSDYSYGHLMSSSASPGERVAGKYAGVGYTSPYHAAFSR